MKKLSFQVFFFFEERIRRQGFLLPPHYANVITTIAIYQHTYYNFYTQNSQYLLLESLAFIDQLLPWMFRLMHEVNGL